VHRKQGIEIMIAALLTALFSAIVLFAICAIVHAALRYGPGFLSLRHELRTAERSRTVRYETRTVEVTRCIPGRARRSLRRTAGMTALRPAPLRVAA
jgi:hypothetical protein